MWTSRAADDAAVRHGARSLRRRTTRRDARRAVDGELVRPARQTGGGQTTRLGGWGPRRGDGRGAGAGLGVGG